MQPINRKLNETFNKCAGKIVAMHEVEDFVMTTLETKLTAQEMDIYKAITGADQANVDRLFRDKSFEEKLVKEVGDGSIGIYLAFADGIPIPAYIHTKFLELTLGKGFPEIEVAEKVLNTYAEAIEKAEDRRDEVKVDVKRGKVQAVKPRQP